jgi:hypothetical protein
MLIAISVTGCGPNIGNWKKHLLTCEPSTARQLWKESKMHETKAN